MKTKRKMNGHSMAEGFIQNFVEALFTENAELLNEKFMELPAKDMFNVLGKLLPYVAPKQGVRKDEKKEETVTCEQNEAVSCESNKENDQTAEVKEVVLSQEKQETETDDDVYTPATTKSGTISQDYLMADIPPHPVKVFKEKKLPQNNHVPFYVGVFAKHRRRKY